DLLEQIKTPTDDRAFKIFELIRRGVSLRRIHLNTSIDEFFLRKFKNIVDMENTLKNSKLDNNLILEAKKLGFSDMYLKDIYNMSELEFYKYRKDNNIKPVYKMIDTCASEFDSYVGYFYSTYEIENESIVSNKRKVIILGSGPIRIGQGVEFDYSTVHAIWAIKELGYEAIVINNNPETVSTDYLVTDKLYFEPLTIEDVMNIVDLEQAEGVIVELGGQTAINLTSKLTELNVKIIGTDNLAIENAENRNVFEKLLKNLNIPQPEGMTVMNKEDGLKVANKLKYPLLVRPSYVLGGRAMQIVYSDDQLLSYLDNAFKVSNDKPVLIDKYIIGREVEVDAVCDLKEVFIPGIMQHIEGTGVHSGDSISVYPSLDLSKKVKDTIVEYTTKLGINIGIIGLFNIQFIVDENDNVSVIEVNPRSSRSVPFISKASGYNIANIATKVMLGKSLKQQNIKGGLAKEKDTYYVKTPTFSNSKIKGLDPLLSPEMKSTGEAIGYDKSLNKAIYKSFKASNMKVVNYGTILVTLSDKTKEKALPLIKRFYDLGFNIEATQGSFNFLKANGIKTRLKRK
ncbi:MAG: carbamoyl-phosphate synthase large subunit, partial [Anaeroplasmataceae bacterium]